jgi:penicillin-binding protein-related factor A (putative recombinase)
VEIVVHVEAGILFAMIFFLEKTNFYELYINRFWKYTGSHGGSDRAINVEGLAESVIFCTFCNV